MTSHPRYNYPQGRAIDIPPHKDIFDWIMRNFPYLNDNPKCDFGAYYNHWATPVSSNADYTDNCNNLAKYRYIHTSKDEESFLDIFRCEGHKIDAREGLLMYPLR